MKTLAALNRRLQQLVDKEIEWKLSHNRSEFPHVEKYVSDDMIVQDALRVVIQEQNITDTRTIREMGDYIEEKGYNNFAPPKIDWFHFADKAYNDVQYFVKNQKQISPDLNATDTELARDWWNLWQEEVLKLDIKGAMWFRHLFVPMIKQIVEDLGYGDITSTSYVPPTPIQERTENIITPHDNGEGGKDLVDSNGRPIEHDESNIPPAHEMPKFDMGDANNTKQEMMDELLDKLLDAQKRGDAQQVARLQKQLTELSTLASKLAWQTVEEEIIDVSGEYGMSCQDIIKMMYGRRYVGDINIESACSSKSTGIPATN